MVSIYINIILAVLVAVLALLLYFRQRQMRENNPLVDLEQILESLNKNLILNRTEGKIQRVAGQLSEILIKNLQSERIIFFRRQRRFMEMNYVYGLKNVKRGKYRIKLSNSLLRELTSKTLIRQPSALSDLLGKDLNELLQAEKFNVVFPIFWLDNIFGVYFISTRLPVDHPLIKTFFLYLNQNLSAAYYIKRLESSRQLTEQNHANDLALSRRRTTGSEEGDDYPGHLIEMFAHRRVDELMSNLFDRIKVGLQADRMMFLAPQENQSETMTGPVIGLPGVDFALDSAEFSQIFGGLKKKQVYSVNSLKDVPDGGELKKRLQDLNIKNLVTFSLVDNQPGLLFWSGRGEVGKSETRLLSRFEKVAQRAMSNAREFERMEAMSYTDGLTRLYNHRYFVKRLGEEIQRAVRYHRSLGLLLFDIDDFKLYNDNFGHQWGDELLRRMGATLSRSLRSIDIVSRYGGDEFCIIMPEADKMTCEIFMERLRHAISTTDFRDQANGFKGQITISVGSAIYPEDADTAERLIYCADMALFHSKEMGRNRSTVFHTEILK